MAIMKKPERTEWLYMDFDSYFASVEQWQHTHLRNKPVAVLPLMSNHTCVIAASREAKHYGIKTGTPVKEAKAKCPHLIFRPAQHHLYVDVHHAIRASVEKVVPIAGIRSIDEIACHLMENESQEGINLAKKIKATLALDIGPTLTCSIGLAPNELLAKIAAEHEKPDGLVAFHPLNLSQHLDNINLKDIPGIGPSMLRRLERQRIFTTRQLVQLNLAQARNIWGNVEGARLVASLQGYTVERPATHKRMFGHSRVLPWDWREGSHVKDCARLLTTKAARRMRTAGYTAQKLNLLLKGPEGRWAGEYPLHHAQDDHTILEALERLFQRARQQKAPLHVKKIGIILHELVHEKDIHPDLFDVTTQNSGQTEDRWKTISHLIDRLRLKHGEKSLYLGQQKRPSGGYAGGKIAFNRVPDKQDFDQIAAK